MKCTSGLIVRSLAAACSPRSAERPFMKTLAPASASRSATWSPIPPEPPVISAALPLNSAGPAIGISLPELVAVARVTVLDKPHKIA
jgi:hypothetical protein